MATQLQRVILVAGDRIRAQGYLAADAAAPTDRVPVYRGGHNQTHTPGTFNLRTMEMKMGKERTDWQPPSVAFADHRFEVIGLSGGKIKPQRKGGKIVADLVVISLEDAEAIDGLTARIRALEDEREALRLAAVKRGRRVTVADCREYKPKGII